MHYSMSGTRNGVPWPGRGETAELPDSEAAELCASGAAEPVAQAEPVETATAPAAETRENAGTDAQSADRPEQADRKAEWIDYAVTQGASRDEAEDMTKAELISTFG
jgi:hypothetical protein